MKKFLFLLLLLPVLGIAQTKTLLTSNRVFAKNDKTGEFEKALANHAEAKYKGMGDETNDDYNPSTRQKIAKIVIDVRMVYF